ncbi:reverse transcriptase domain-containing protein [Tanacetum coccineum]
MEAQYGKFLDMIRAVRINVPLVDVLAGMPNYGKFLKEFISNKHEVEQISSAFLSYETSAMIQNKVPPKLRDPRSFLIPCNFIKAFSCNALADLAENMLVEVGKFTFLVDFIILEMKEDKPPLDLELKPFPDNLEYVFLEEPSFFPVIISSQLSEQNKSKLVFVLKRHKQAFAWKTLDIPEICPSFCKHKIQLLDDKTPVVQKQRRLNPNMQEVIKKEIMKLLDTGIIYPIADSPWVSPIPVYQRKAILELSLTKNMNLSQQEPLWVGECMLDIFHDMIEESVEVFMDDFSVFGNTFDNCLNNLDRMLQRLEIDKAKIDVISKLPPHTNVKSIRSFLGHVSFYRRFIKDFSKITRPLTKLLEKDTPFEFNDECHKSFNSLKEKLTCTPMIVSPNWNIPFELMCDASDFAVGAVLGQKDGKHFHPIYFASKTLNAAQQKYTVTEKELMAVVFAFDKFRPYLILSKMIVYTDQSALRHLFKKQDAKPCTENVVADHLSRIDNDETSDDSDVDDNFPRETLMEITTNDTPWFADFANYLVGDIIPKGMTY